MSIFRYAISVVTVRLLTTVLSPRIITISHKCPPRTQQRPELRHPAAWS